MKKEVGICLNDINENNNTSKRSKRQSDTEILLQIENKNLKEELAHYKDVAFTQKEAAKLKLNVMELKDMLQNLQLKCAICEKSIEEKSGSIYTPSTISTPNMLLEQNKENQNYKSTCSGSSALCVISRVDGSLIQGEILEDKKAEDKGKSEESLGVISQCEETMKLQENLTTNLNKPETSTGQSDDALEKLETPPRQDHNLVENQNDTVANDNFDDDLPHNRLLTTPNDSTEDQARNSTPILEVKEIETDEAFVNTPDKVDLGHGIYIQKSILHNNIRKTDVREAIRDFIRSLFTDLECSKHYISGKRGKEADRAKPELSKPKRSAIEDYVVKTFPTKSRDEIRALILSMLTNKCKNAAKKYKNLLKDKN